MGSEAHVLAVDVGTTSAKVCLYRMKEGAEFPLEFAASGGAGYPIRILPDGGVEQDPEDWWRAACAGVREALSSAGIGPEAVLGMAFCCQMQGLVLVDSSGRAVRPAMSYLDQRAAAQMRRTLGKGIQVEGMDLRLLLPSLAIAGGVSASAKDPVWKLHWVREHEPEAYARAWKWLDVKEYLVARATGRFAMTRDSANATFLYDTRPGREGWSELLCSLFAVERDIMPEVIGAEEVAGTITLPAAEELGLAAGTPVFGGGGDLSMIALGSGAAELGRAHVYMGTSGWVSASVDRRAVDTAARAAAVLGATPGRYNYISEQETSGKCMEWFRDHLALDEIGLYLGARNVCEGSEAAYESVFQLLDETVDSVPPGAGGVIFAPWLHGSRSPFEDSNARGIFFNLGLETGKRCLVRAVAEGLALQTRWQLEAVRRKVALGGPLRFVGGGARSRSSPAILADVVGMVVEVTGSPQNAGALGAAIVCAVGLGRAPSLEAASALIPAVRVHEPRPGHQEVYDRHFAVLKRLYRDNRASFRILNASAGKEA